MEDARCMVLGGDGYELTVPFLIDDDAHTDRDREMFVLGYEFCLVHRTLEGLSYNTTASRTVHRANEDRIRMLCSRFDRRCTFEVVDETWCFLEVEPA